MHQKCRLLNNIYSWMHLCRTNPEPMAQNPNVYLIMKGEQNILYTASPFVELVEMPLS